MGARDRLGALQSWQPQLGRQLKTEVSHSWSPARATASPATGRLRSEGAVEAWIKQAEAGSLPCAASRFILGTGAHPARADCARAT